MSTTRRSVKKTWITPHSYLGGWTIQCIGYQFYGPFVSLFGNKYILVVVDYVSKWVEAIALPNNEWRSVVQFLKRHIFARFGTPSTIISDAGSHFCNEWFSVALNKYEVKHKIATPYHPKQVIKLRCQIEKLREFKPRQKTVTLPTGLRIFMMQYGHIVRLTRHR